MVKSPEVIFHPSVVEYLDTPGKQLFDNGYSGYRGNAVQYIPRMVDYISSCVHLHAAIPAPGYFEKYGSHLKYIYCTRGFVHSGPTPYGVRHG
jgi:hypothetical protein